MYFLKNTEIDMNFYFSHLYKRLLCYKLLNENYELVRNFKIFFVFRNIRVITGLYIFNYILFIWLTTGLCLKVDNYGYVYQRGVYYYRFMLIEQSKFFQVLDFFINFFFICLNKNDISLSICTNNRILFKVKSYEVFANMRLSSNLYIYELDDPFYLDFLFNNNGKLLLSFLKLDYYLKKKDKWIK